MNNQLHRVELQPPCTIPQSSPREGFPHHGELDRMYRTIHAIRAIQGHRVNVPPSLFPGEETRFC